MRVRQAVRVRRQPSTEGLVSFVVVSSAVLFVFAQLSPSLIFSSTTVAGGDTGAHVWGPAFMRDHLLGSFRLSGWAPDWYAGFPAYTFYFPLPALAVVVADLVMPYNIALKLITVVGILALPGAVFAFARLVGLRFPIPAVMAVATVPFLFDRGFTIYGGNIASTLAGEFSFSISLALSFLFLGAFHRAVVTGRGQALAAVLLLVTGLTHAYTTVFAVVGAVLIFVLEPSRGRFRRSAAILGVSALLASFWALPLLARLPYANSMYYERVTSYTDTLFPQDLRWLVLMAAVGVVFSVTGKLWAGQFLAIMASAFALVFTLIPDGHLWNPRFVPFWFLCLYLLAGIALAELGRVVARAYSAAGVTREPRRSVLLATPAVAAVMTWAFVGLPLGLVPEALASTEDRSFVPSWARWNYSGYEAKSGYPEYQGLIDTMTEVGQTNGCGRAHWQYENERIGPMGSPLALMLLPYWTDGCIGSMEGLFFESSATTPYHFMSASELSPDASRPMRRLPYSGFDIEAGVSHLQILGVRYYMAFSPEVVEAADGHPDLELVDTSGDWRIYEVADSELVVPLENTPAVVSGLSRGSRPWLDVAVNWWVDADAADVVLAAGGPQSWPRVELTEVASTSEQIGDGYRVARPPADPTAGVEVSDVSTDTDRISFTVDRPGVPVLVRTSYFPNWKASGAEGPWRVTPNFMVVVPTDNEVELSYGYTPVDIAGWVLSLAGVGGLILLVRPGRGREPDLDRASALEGDVPPGEDPAGGGHTEAAPSDTGPSDADHPAETVPTREEPATVAAAGGQEAAGDGGKPGDSPSGGADLRGGESRPD